MSNMQIVRSKDKLIINKVQTLRKYHHFELPLQFCTQKSNFLTYSRITDNFLQFSTIDAKLFQSNKYLTVLAPPIGYTNSCTITSNLVN